MSLLINFYKQVHSKIAYSEGCWSVTRYKVMSGTPSMTTSETQDKIASLDKSVRRFTGPT